MDLGQPKMVNSDWLEEMEKDYLVGVYLELFDQAKAFLLKRQSHLKYHQGNLAQVEHQMAYQALLVKYRHQMAVGLVLPALMGGEEMLPCRKWVTVTLFSSSNKIFNYFNNSCNYFACQPKL